MLFSLSTNKLIKVQANEIQSISQLIEKKTLFHCVYVCVFLSGQLDR